MDQRYRTPDMDLIWGPYVRNRYEHQLWIEVMRAQQEAGVPIPPEAIAEYEAALFAIVGYGEVALKEIAAIETETKHDLYARLQYFNQVAGYEWAHLGLTSADIVENVQQRQIVESAKMLVIHAEQVALRLAKMAAAFSNDAMVARTHGQPAQLTTVGKRYIDWAAELLEANSALETAVQNYPARGIKGAVGTRIDMAALLMRHRPSDADDSALERADLLDRLWTQDTEFGLSLAACGQTYPRSIDLPILSAVLQLTAACDTICTNIRLWAVLGHANEQRDPGQVGSSAMPHKTNPRYSERVHSLCVVARGYNSMLQEIAGAQWFEGDVSTSAARRVALPGLFHAVDATLANTAYALDRLQVDRVAVAMDVRRHLPQLASGLILESCVAAGVDRSVAHARMAEHTRKADLDWEGGLDWLSRLHGDPLIPLDLEQLRSLVSVERLVEPAVWIVNHLLTEAGEDVQEPLDPQWPEELI